MAAHEHLVWIDCEMTGLDVSRDALVEVACLVTDADLTVLGHGISVVIKPPAAAIDGMSDFVRDMHAASGLLPELASGVEIGEAEDLVLAYIREHASEGKAPLAGNTVGMDRMFLERDMPTLSAWLHYRIVDVSSIKELARRWYPRAYFHAPEKTGGHRALGDIQDSVRELRYYRQTIFVPPPGPDSDSVRKAAEAVADGPKPSA
jgi:oligoribonuclease